MGQLQKLLGKDAASILGVESKHFALRASLRPMDIGALGSFSVGMATGILPAALGANSEVFQFRWSSALNLCIIRSVRVSAVVSTTFFAAGVPVQIDMKVARTWTGDGTGGTAQVFSTANTNKKRTNMPLSSLSDTGVRIATTAALGAGTKVLDTNPLVNLMAPGPITASLNGLILPPTFLWNRNGSDEYPLLFAQNEGFVIRSVAVPATGTWQMTVDVEWTEVANAAEGWQ